MKKAFASVFTFILVATLMLSAVLPVSATQTDYQDYENYFWQKLGQYRNEMMEIYGEDFAMTDYFHYDEIFRYYSGNECATPDFVLVAATYYYDDTPYAYRYDFGEYTYSSYSLGDKCFVYLPEEDTVYTLEEAYYNRVEGLEEALAYIYGEALGKNGDADGDTFVNIKDATYIQEYVAKMIECGNSNPYVNNLQLFERVADVNRDHKINVKDATVIQKLLAKLLIPTTYEKTPATADSVEYTQVDLGYGADFGNSDRLVTNTAQLNAYPNNPNKTYTEEFFEENAFVYIYRTYYSGMVEGFVDGVYREGDTLYVKYREVHPPINLGVTDDIGVFHVALEIDKELLEGVTKLSVDTNRYHLPPTAYQ